MNNRSAPTHAILPHITYDNVADAIVWLTNTFGFTEHYRYGAPDGSVDGAQMRFGEAWFMLNIARLGRTTPAEAGGVTQFLTVFVGDVDQHFSRVKAAGARIIEDLNETQYGERQYAAEDLGGHRWLFSQHVRDVSPEEWGAVVAAQ